MKKYSFVTITFILSILSFIFSEQVKAQRYLSGQKGVQFTGGFIGKSNESFAKEPAYYVGVSLATYTRNGNRWVVGIEYLNKEYPYREKVIPVSKFIGDGGYYFKLLSDNRKTFFLSFGLSASAGYETSNWGEKLLYDGATLRNKDAFIYGGSATIELETYLSDRLVLLINARERLLFGSSIDKFQTQYGIGIKYIIN